MPWFKVDDKLWGSAKWLGTPARARGLWVTAGAYCADQLTDGLVRTHVLPTLGGTSNDAAALVRSGLWEPDAEGWRFHDWDEFQPSREQILTERAAARERQQRAREKARAARAGGITAGQGGVSRRDTPVTHGVSHAPVTPDVTVPPTRPDPTTKGKTRPAEPDTFDEWWQAYPRKEGKGRARPAYTKAVRDVPADKLLRLTAEWFAARPDLEAKFIPQPASWLNARRWEDEPPTARPGDRRPGSSVWDRRTPPPEAHR